LIYRALNGRQHACRNVRRRFSRAGYFIPCEFSATFARGILFSHAAPPRGRRAAVTRPEIYLYDPQHGGRHQSTGNNGLVRSRAAGTLKRPRTTSQYRVDGTNVNDARVVADTVLGGVRGVRDGDTRQDVDNDGGRTRTAADYHRQNRGVRSGRVHPEANQQGERRRFVHVRVRGVRR